MGGYGRSIITGGSFFMVAAICGCVTNRQTDLPRAAIVVGDVKLADRSRVINLDEGRILRPGDTVRVADNAKVKFECMGGASWYLSRSSQLVIGEPVEVSRDKRRLPVSLLSGRIHIVKRDDVAEEYLVNTPEWAIRVGAADITICAGSDARECGVSLLAGFATFAVPGGTETVIPSCSRLMSSLTMPGELRSLRPDDIAAVKSWVGTTVIDEALAASGCISGQGREGNEPPRWQRMVRENASLSEKFIDTIEALDPEQTEIVYSIENAPPGMKLDAITGAVVCSAAASGTYRYSLIATDADAGSCTAFVSLTVQPGLSLSLRAPRSAAPGIPITVSAVTHGVDPTKVMLRFDLDGDGRYDFPKNGAFGTSIRVNGHVYNSEGTFLIRAEAKTSDNHRATAKRQIVVNSPPKVVLAVTPEVITAGSPVELDASGSSDTRNGAVALKFRFDVDGNGTWDLPEGNQLMSSSRASYAWEQPGNYRVVVQAVDMDGATATAFADVVVSKGLNSGTIEGGDTVHTGDSLQIVCKPPRSDYPIKEYAWSFDGDTVFEKSGPKPYVRTKFGTAGIRTLLCRMTDQMGQKGFASKVITVVNVAATIDAGGPYRIGVNRELLLKGTGSDRDSKIVGYSWDVDGDGAIDLTSKDKPQAVYTYTKAGKYMLRFYIETDDHRKSVDSAQVEVINTPPRASAGEDVVSRKGRKVRLSGTGTDDDGSIAKYEWDFNGDGVADWSSVENGDAEHEFDIYTVAVFRVTDSDGATAVDTIRIVVCPEDMKAVEKGKFCIDVYEFPNKRSGTPQTDVSYEEALEACRSVGKRLCTASEWEMACRGDKGVNQYPYGRKYDANHCNTLGNGRVKNSIAESGEFYECRGDADIFDMSGNAAEWVQGGFVYGGSWQNGAQGSGCGSKMQLETGRKYFYAGLRCCK